MSPQVMDVPESGSQGSSLLETLANQFDRDQFNRLNETMSFEEYLDKVAQNPWVAFSSYQRVFDMVLQRGVETYKRFGKTNRRYLFFAQHPQFPIFGLEEPISEFVNAMKGAAGYYGTEKRLLLLHGPVGSSKSTVARAIKSGLEEYSRTARGAMYTFDWIDLPDTDDALGAAVECRKSAPSPMHDDPLRLIPVEMRPVILTVINERLNAVRLHENDDLNEELHQILKVRLNGEANPYDKFIMKALMLRYKGDWLKVVRQHIRVRRLEVSEVDRVCIGTFQPKDEKNQDATELTGDINFVKLGKYGADSDPRAFNFDGEFQVAHRGVLEFIEVLKLDQQFLYDLLGAAQEQQVKPKKFAQTYVDVMIVGHTNNPEYVRLEKNAHMEALKDRMVRIDWPYNLRLTDELRVLEQDYNPQKVRQFISPHTLEVCAMFGILSRLKLDSKELQKIDPVKKMKLYDGKDLPGYTEENVREMMMKHPTEGMDEGVSARYLQNKLSNALVKRHDTINFFMVLHELKEGLRTYALLGDNQELRRKYEHCLELVKKELDEMLKNEVRRAIAMDDDAVTRLYTNYLDNVFAYIEKRKVKNEFTGEDEEPNERLMRSIEEKVDIGERYADDFRRSIAAYVGNIVRNEGKEALRWDRNPQLARALELKLFDDTKDTIKLSSITKVPGIIDKDNQERIETIKARLIKNCGYDDRSASDVLHYVGSIFARGDIQEQG